MCRHTEQTIFLLVELRQFGVGLGHLTLQVGQLVIDLRQFVVDRFIAAPAELAGLIKPRHLTAGAAQGIHLLVVDAHQFGIEQFETAARAGNDDQETAFNFAAGKVHGLQPGGAAYADLPIESRALLLQLVQEVARLGGIDRVSHLDDAGTDRHALSQLQGIAHDLPDNAVFVAAQCNPFIGRIHTRASLCTVSCVAREIATAASLPWPSAPIFSHSARSILNG